MAEEQEGRIQEVERSLTTLESQLREQIARAQSGTRTVLIVGIILIAFIFTYLTVLTAKLKPWTEPRALAEVLQSKASDQLPALEKSLQEQAPEVVKNLREKAVSEIPVLGNLAETKVLAFVDTLADKFAAGTDQIVGTMLEKHAAELKPLLQDAVKPGNAEKIRKDFTNSLEELIGWKLDEALKDYDATLDLVEQRLDRLLLPDKQLTPDEKLEKEMATSLMFLMDETLTLPVPAPPPGAMAPAPKMPAMTAPATTMPPPATPPAAPGN